MYFKAFIRVVKSIRVDYYEYFGDVNIVEERQLLAKDKKEVKDILLKKYPQFFQNGKIYEKETKDKAQFFYVVIYPLYNHEIEKIEKGQWKCDYCGQIHENTYISYPRKQERILGDLQFCKSDDDYCINQYKKEKYKNIELPDDEMYIKKDCPNYIYKITEKKTGKCYIGKTKNEPFFRWWNHLTHSTSPFGIYLRTTKLSDWTFEVIDILPYGVPDKEVFALESKYINDFDSINNGYNSVISNKSSVKDNYQQKLLLK